jgi:hypothetical protein
MGELGPILSRINLVHLRAQYIELTTASGCSRIAQLLVKMTRDADSAVVSSTRTPFLLLKVMYIVAIIDTTLTPVRSQTRRCFVGTLVQERYLNNRQKLRPQIGLLRGIADGLRIAPRTAKKHVSMSLRCAFRAVLPAFDSITAITSGHCTPIGVYIERGNSSCIRSLFSMELAAMWVLFSSSALGPEGPKF